MNEKTKSRRYLRESAIQETKDVNDENNDSDCTDSEDVSTTEEDVPGFKSTLSESRIPSKYKRVQSMVDRCLWDRESSDDEHFDCISEDPDFHPDIGIGHDDEDWSEGNY